MRILTEQEETILFNDICMRLTYGVKVAEMEDDAPNGAYEVLSANKETMTIGFNTPSCLIRCYRNMEMVRPYLRPLSSMTDKEREEYRKFSYYGAAGMRDNDFTEMVAVPSFEKLDFLNSNHFDYRGLIPKGLAIAVTKDNNPYK